MAIHYGGLKSITGYRNLALVLIYMIGTMQFILQSFSPHLPEPLNLLTPASLRVMNLSVHILSDRAKRQLGYEPIFSVEEGIQLSVLEFNDPKACIHHA
jgi:hypothetical protein